MITLEFAQELHQIDADFVNFCSTGIAAKISSMTSCYSMYVNALDRQPEKKKEIIKMAPDIVPSKAVSPVVEESKAPIAESARPNNVSTQNQQRLAQLAAINQKKKKDKKKEKAEKDKKVDDDEDDMAFLDKVIQENSTCFASGCQAEVKRAYYCQCNKCGRAFCSAHVQVRNHDCENATAAMPAQSHYSFAAAERS